MAQKTSRLPVRVLRFGVFQVNIAARELRKHGVQIRLPGQPFCILSLLLEKPGEVVSREEMRTKLWAFDTFVDFEHSLNSAVKKLRAALGDSPENPRYIETLPRLGYRFIAPVEEVFSTAGKSAPETSLEPSVRTPAAEVKVRRFGRPLLLGISTLLVTASIGYFAWSRVRSRPQPPSGRLILAVLPFENLTGDAGQDYFSEGLTEEMTAQLVRIDPEHLGVIGRASAIPGKQSQEQMAEIERELGAQYVLQGSVRRGSDRLRVTAELIQTRDQTHVWSRQYDRELTNLLVLQGEIAQEIADEIQLMLGDRRRPIPADRRPAPSPSYEAYDLYLKGRYFWNKRTKDGFQHAADYFEQSIAKDPNYARAYAGLADTFTLMSTWSFVSANEFVPKARAAALKALQLDDGLAEAHTTLALIAQVYDYDWLTAEKEYRRAIELDPQYSTAHQWYAECLSLQGRFDEALAESGRARQLDPLSLIIATDDGAILYFSRQYDRAIEQFRLVQAMEPNFPRARMIALAYAEKGMFAEALEEAGKPSYADGIPPWGIQAFIYGRAGQPLRARRALENWRNWQKGHPLPTSSTAIMPYIALGRTDEAIALLRRAHSEHSSAILEIKVAPFYDPLRGDPRFQDLLHRVGLAQ